jgi:hypothetical protein
MKKLKLFCYLPLILSGFLSYGFCEETMQYDELLDDQFVDANQIDKKLYQVDQRIFSELVDEPAIQGLALSKSIKLVGDSSVLINAHMSPNSEITTQAGMQTFFPYNDGILVKKSGLYRVSFFQRAFARGEKTRCLVFLMLSPGNYVKRYQVYNFESDKNGELNFSQIIRIDSGQKVAVHVRCLSGELFLGPNFESSGLVIEAISP